MGVRFLPEAKGVESLARHIKLTGRAYPLFDIAAFILKKPDRFQIEFQVIKGADGKILQPLVVCSLDESVWLDEDEVVVHALRHHFATFYQTEKVPADPPKGTYTLVGQCPLSGVIFGPPNLHEYQEKVRKLHAERFSRMPFEVYKARIRMVRDEAVVKQWIDEQSWRMEYVCLNVPEPVKFKTREEVEQHFRTTHLPNLVRTVESFLLPASGQRPMASPRLMALQRRALEDQRRFPLAVATMLSQQFAGYGLQFFKVNRTVTHVCVARPHYLDLNQVVVSDGVKQIVDYIDRHPGTTRRALLDALAPGLTSSLAATVAPAPAPAEPGAPAPAQTGAAPSEPAASGAPLPSPEQTALISDLHWLIHQGHVIEFSDGRMETAKAPRPKPTPPPKAVPEPATPVATPLAAPENAAVPTEPARADSPVSGEGAPPTACVPDAVPVAPVESAVPVKSVSAEPMVVPEPLGATPAPTPISGEPPAPEPSEPPATPRV